jgi:4-hydroxythreonine-4-phosphate dehydrogenase
MKKFVFTCGDINGIGPEIVVKVLNRVAKESSQKENPGQFFFICPSNVFKEAYALVNADFNYIINKKFVEGKDPGINIIDSGKVKIRPGLAASKSGKAAYKSVKSAFNLVKEKKADAMITAPISKKALKLAGISFTGHTEMLAKWSGTKKYIMMFLSEKMNAALLTIHEPLKKVPGLITAKKIREALETVNKTFKNDLNIPNPRISLLGLNPHAGEEGVTGREEKKIIIPLVKKLNMEYNLSGPFPADGFFASGKFKDFDLVLGMYHDQVLIPFKMMNFSTGVNYTAGLPIVRTSPDHGTAFDIAWENKADESSLYQAYKYAELISVNRYRNATR